MLTPEEICEIVENYAPYHMAKTVDPRFYRELAEAIVTVRPELLKENE